MTTVYFFPLRQLTEFEHCVRKKWFIAIIMGDDKIYYKSDIGNR